MRLTADKIKDMMNNSFCRHPSPTAQDEMAIFETRRGACRGVLAEWMNSMISMCQLADSRSRWYTFVRYKQVARRERILYEKGNYLRYGGSCCGDDSGRDGRMQRSGRLVGERFGIERLC